MKQQVFLPSMHLVGNVRIKIASFVIFCSFLIRHIKSSIFMRGYKALVSCTFLSTEIKGNKDFLLARRAAPVGGKISFCWQVNVVIAKLIGTAKKS